MSQTYGTDARFISDNNSSLYDPRNIARLFDEMSRTYGLVNLVSSLGFSARWRGQCIALAEIQPGMMVCDYMTGMGECLHRIQSRVGSSGKIVALDISEAMCARAQQHAETLHPSQIEVLVEDALESASLRDASFDGVVSSFGLKTFNDHQLAVFAAQVARVLKPGGRFSLLEISIPSNALLRLPFKFYIDRVIPRVGRMFMGNPDNYKMLGTYTERFGNCTVFADHLRAEGLNVFQKSFFFGCATAVYGEKPTY